MRRRRFVKLMAAGAAAMFAQPLAGRGLAAPKRPGPAEPSPASGAVRREIASQKKSVADTLRAIRAFKLPPGSPPAYVFRARKRGGDDA